LQITFLNHLTNILEISHQQLINIYCKCSSPKRTTDFTFIETDSWHREIELLQLLFGRS